jgi:hypothetical protein
MKIDFDGTVGIMSGTHDPPIGKTYLLIKKKIGKGTPIGKTIKHNYYKKGAVIDFKKFDVVFSFTSPKSIDVIIKILKQAKKDLKIKT